MKRWLYFAGLVLSVLTGAAFVAYVLNTLDTTGIRNFLNPGTAMAMAMAILLCACAPPIGALAWKRILRSLGYPATFLPLNAIVLTTQAGKYLPGNIAHHVGRIGLSMSLGLPTPAILASLAYELPLILMTSIIVGGAFALLDAQGLALIASHRDGIVLGAVIAATLLAGVMVAAKVLPRLIAWSLAKRNHDPGSLGRLGIRDISAVLAINSIAYIASGLAVYILATRLFPGISVGFPLLAAAFAIAWAVGFVTPGAPAGIGIRETLLMLMLGDTMGVQESSILVAALRIATTLGDLLCFVAGAALLWRLRRNGTGTTGGRIDGT